MRFKNDRIEYEWESRKLDKRVIVIILYLDWYCKHFITRIDGKKEDIQLTHIYRTQKEQENIYGKGTRKKSTHQYWRACDIGVNAFSTEAKKQIADEINRHFKNIGKAKCCVWHDVGLGDHFHIQVGSSKHSKFYR